MGNTKFDRWVVAGMICAAVLVAAPAPAFTPSPRVATPRQQAPVANPAASAARPAIDRSGRRRVGKASVYARKFDGRQMADGTTMDTQSDSAASKTLPLGTVAKVTNLQTGQSAVVTVRDRGPHVAGRIVDLSPASAQQVGIGHRQGVARVAVTPLSLPGREGGKLARQGVSSRRVVAGPTRAKPP